MFRRPKYADPDQKWETVQALTLAESFVAGYTGDPDTGDIHSEITANPKWQEGAEVTLRHSATPRPLFKTFVYVSKAPHLSLTTAVDCESRDQ